jgi:YD repeat-containing protein
LQALDYMDGVKLARTGVSGSKDAIEPNSLNRTATGVQAQQSANNMRIELIARTLAGGFRDLFLITHALALKHSTKPIQIKLRGKWTPVNPREWRQRTDFTVSVGLGTGTPEAQMAKLGNMMPLMQTAQQAGLAGPDELYNFACEIWKAAGYKTHARFVKEPQKDPQTGQSMMPPPQPIPQVLVEQERQKGDAQKTQATLAHEQQMAQMTAMFKQKELELNAMLKKAEQEGALALQQSNDQRQSALDQQKFELEQQKAEMDKDLQVQLANIAAAARVEVARIGKGIDDGTALLVQQEREAGYAEVVLRMQQMQEAMSAPRSVVRDENGRAVGIEHAGTMHAIARDEQGKVIGTQPQVQPEQETEDGEAPAAPKPSLVLERLSEQIQQHQQNQMALTQDMAQRSNAPKRVLRDDEGRVVGMEQGGSVHEVVRDQQGRVIGTRPVTTH